MAIDKASIEKGLEKKPEEISIIKLVDDILEFAFKSRASDVHIDPAETHVEVRLRIDGVMEKVFRLSKEIQSEVISRIKVLSGLRTDEHQIAQDGRFRFITSDKKDKFDIRVSIVPTYYEENVVMRLLTTDEKKLTLEDLGYAGKDLEKIKEAMKKPYGMILATGPTGSGKTTTLYTILKMLNTPDVSIITIEDPIEFSLEGIEQIQVNPETGLTFADGLRAILRQDPNIVMVGEIRDQETANISVNAALTGHLLLSTLHTNDAPTTLPRLLDMKVEPFLIASTVNVAIGQRLVRKICSKCKKEKKYSINEMAGILEAGIPADWLKNSQTFYAGEGCNECNNTGYHGRIGIYEVMEVTEAIREAIVNRMEASEIKKLAIHEGMTTMLEDGVKKVLAGITTMEEILRVIHE